MALVELVEAAQVVDVDPTGTADARSFTMDIDLAPGTNRAIILWGTVKRGQPAGEGVSLEAPTSVTFGALSAQLQTQYFGAATGGSTVAFYGYLALCPIPDELTGVIACEVLLGGAGIRAHAFYATVAVNVDPEASISTLTWDVNTDGNATTLNVNSEAAESAEDMILAVGFAAALAVGFTLPWQFDPALTIVYEQFYAAGDDSDAPTTDSRAWVETRQITGVTGVQAFSLIGNEFTPGDLFTESWGLTSFRLPASTEPTPDEEETINFNCECEDVNDNLTLAEYRQRMLVRAGFAAVASNPPPGVAELFNTFLQDSQEFIYRKYPALRTRRFFRWRMEEGVRFYGMQENDENWTDATVTLAAADPGTVTFTGDAPPDDRQIAFKPITGSSLPPEITAYQRYYVVGSTGSVCNIAETLGGTAIEFTDGMSATATYSPGVVCIFNMEPYKNIDGAYIEDVNGTWLPLASPIPPTFYTTVSQYGMPVRYEIRQCIEVFPAPSSNDWKLWIKGHFGLKQFTADTDKPTIDGHLVYLFALANCLDYYGKPSAGGVMAQAREYLGELVAGTHGSKRYVPGTSPLPPAVMPVLLPLPGE